LAAVVGWVACGAAATAAQDVKDAQDAKDAFYFARLLGRGVNLGNGLDAPREGDWGYRIEADHFKRIKEAGFDAVRIPIRWSAHAAAEAPFAIDAAFFRRVDKVLDQALAQRLAVVINVHHYDEMFRQPDKHAARLAALWTQIAERYRARPDSLLFELLNEPNGTLDEDRWNRMLPELLAVVRKSNPQRAVIVGPGHWNNVDRLAALALPNSDRMLIATFHYYSPFEFTHQAASWVPGSEKWKGRKWSGTPDEVAAIARDFDKAAAWAKKQDRPMYLGEFGAYSAADMDSRAAWTRAVTRQAKGRGFSSAYWEFASGFGAYDRTRTAWNEPLLRALLDR
jgi:endoglucanase